MPDRFYHPSLEDVRKQSRANRQGGEEKFDVGTSAEDARTAEEFLGYLQEMEQAYQKYLTLTDKGVSRELARIGLPVNIYTEWYWKCDLHNTLRFLSLRLDAHAQSEIREYAQAMAALIEPLVPVTMEAFRDYELGALHLTRLETEAMQRQLAGGDGTLASDNQRERAEWDANRARIGLAIGAATAG